MEKRIKTLYIMSIAAIIAFLAMQGWWLLERWQYGIFMAGQETLAAVKNSFSAYEYVRQYCSKEPSRIIRSTYNVDHKLGDSVTATVKALFWDSHKVLGVPEDSILRYDATEKVKNLIAAMDLPPTSDSCLTIDLEGISDDIIWGGMHKAELEMRNRFTVEGLDSILRKDGIVADLSLSVTDTIQWNVEIIGHSGFLFPLMTVRLPYSPLQRKVVDVDVRLRVADIFRNLAGVFVAAAVVSLFLILCLIWQIATIRRLNRIVNMRDNFVHTMIHELKRPVSTLKMCVSSLDNARLMESPATKAEILADCRHAIDNLSTCFSRMRDITFNDSGQIPLDLTSCRLRDIISELMAKFIVPSGKVVHVTDITDDASVSAVCDRMHLSQMIANLVENAVKYSSSSVDIDISYGYTPDGVFISVADNGNGISEADCSRIFDKFYRCRPAVDSQIYGVGLGLAYVRMLAQAHGGDISVSSREGEGSIFTIILPQQ